MKRSTPWVWLIGGSLFVVLMVLVLFLVFSSPRTTTRPPDSTEEPLISNYLGETRGPDEISVYRFYDKTGKAICYIARGGTGVGVSCLPSKEVER